MNNTPRNTQTEPAENVPALYHQSSTTAWKRPPPRSYGVAESQASISASSWKREAVALCLKTQWLAAHKTVSGVSHGLLTSHAVIGMPAQVVLAGAVPTPSAPGGRWECLLEQAF
jgi:hypothetical protein